MKDTTIFRIFRIICIFTLFCGTMHGQTTNSVWHSRLKHQLQFNVGEGYVFQGKNFMKGENLKNEPINNALSLHLKYAFQFAPGSFLGSQYPHTYQGIGVSYNTFFNPEELGNPVGLYVFQGSRIARLSSCLSLDYEWNFGASFGWKPYNEYLNPNNKVVGSKVNAYINLGLYMNWQMNRQWKLTAGVDATHFSNGNTHYPNAGVNLVGARIGLTRLFDSNPEAASSPRQSNHEVIKTPRITYDFVAYGAAYSKIVEEERYLVPGSFGVAGFNFNPLYRFNKYFKAGASLDGLYDAGANIKDHIAYTDEDGRLRFYRPSFREQTSLGISLRAEFVMPIFSINFGIGHNFLYKGDDLSGFYQMLILKTDITRDLFLHIGYQLNKFHDPKNLMLGMGYRFHK